MIPQEIRAMIWNDAISAAVKAYPNGIGSILDLKYKYVVTVEHVGTTTKQEVEIIDGNR